MLDTTLNIFRAVGEETRLRIAVLLSRGELTVTELTQILGQSQPRVSRHLKILADAGLVERFREGAWMFYRMVTPLDDAPEDSPAIATMLSTLKSLAVSNDRVLSRDRERFSQSRQARAAVAADYFDQNAEQWDQVRRLHLPDADIEQAMLDMVGLNRNDPDMPGDGYGLDKNAENAIDLFIDLGTGTGRMLEVFANHYARGIGYDSSREMLSVARSKLETAKISHAQVRHGDLFALPAEPGTADLVCIHQVLHFLTEPGNAVMEAARLLKPRGRLIISDFAPHGLEFLRDDHAHRRLGFSDNEVRDWCRRAGLNFVGTQSLSTVDQHARGQLTVKIWMCSLADVKQSVSSTYFQPVTSS